MLISKRTGHRAPSTSTGEWNLTLFTSSLRREDATAGRGAGLRSIRHGEELVESAEVSLLGRIETIAREITAGGDVAAILRGTAMAVSRHTPWSMCWVGLLDL